MLTAVLDTPSSELASLEAPENSVVNIGEAAEDKICTKNSHTIALPGDPNSQVSCGTDSGDKGSFTQSTHPSWMSSFHTVYTT